jgi:hypothetical protein
MKREGSPRLLRGRNNLSGKRSSVNKVSSNINIIAEVFLFLKVMLVKF